MSILRGGRFASKWRPVRNGNISVHRGAGQVTSVARACCLTVANSSDRKGVAGHTGLPDMGDESDQRETVRHQLRRRFPKRAARKCKHGHVLLSSWWRPHANNS